MATTTMIATATNPPITTKASATNVNTSMQTSCYIRVFVCISIRSHILPLGTGEQPGAYPML